ncbi:YjbH domain-containing protein [Tellurirhabdus rosea]|uniref:YjbH domain-containing protein n=1 Tax=Tellurirhabdus rosea TaxID=2674997 RepID=UPI002254D994|nr:YjbH domain-containing protein [Tellurirhabdus rosea]
MKRASLLLFGLTLSAGLRAQSLRDLEAVTADSNRIYYDQRLYRNPMRAMELVSRAPGNNGQQKTDNRQQTTELVPLFQGVPVAAYRLGSEVQAQMLSRAERRAFSTAHPFDARGYKFDFRLLPEFSAIFGYREKVVETKTNLLLQSQWMLGRGLVLNWGVLFPLINNWDNQPRNIRPAPIFLNQFLALGGADFMSLSAGLFYNDRYGLNAQYRHADLTKPWSFGLETGLTGFYFYPPDNIYYETLNDLTLLADVAYRFPVHDITIKLSGGQYQYKDRGVRIDFIRQFANVEVGFYAMQTGNGATGGFNFAIPLLPGPLLRAKRVRLRAAEEFRWEYAYSRGYRIGERYRTGYQLDALLRQYHQNYLNSQYRPEQR